MFIVGPFYMGLPPIKLGPQGNRLSLVGISARRLLYVDYKFNSWFVLGHYAPIRVNYDEHYYGLVGIGLDALYVIMPFCGIH